MRDLARRWKALEDEVKTLNGQIAALVERAASELVELHGVGVVALGRAQTPARIAADGLEGSATSPSSDRDR